MNEFRFGFTNVDTSTGFPIEGAAALTQLHLTRREHQPAPDYACVSDVQLQRGNRLYANRQGQDGSVTQSHTTQFTDNADL